MDKHIFFSIEALRAPGMKHKKNDDLPTNGSTQNLLDGNSTMSATAKHDILIRKRKEDVIVINELKKENQLLKEKVDLLSHQLKSLSGLRAELHKTDAERPFKKERKYDPSRLSFKGLLGEIHYLKEELKKQNAAHTDEVNSLKESLASLERSSLTRANIDIIKLSRKLTEMNNSKNKLIVMQSEVLSNELRVFQTSLDSLFNHFAFVAADQVSEFLKLNENITEQANKFHLIHCANKVLQEKCNDVQSERDVLRDTINKLISLSENELAVEESPPIADISSANGD